MCVCCRKKHKKHHKRSKKAKEAAEENGNGAVIDKIVNQLVGQAKKEINGKMGGQLEVGETEDSDEEKLVDLDSDEVDCTIIEDDIDLEELMKQKVSSHRVCLRV